jgi:thioredoxin reductase (NADPH)
MAEKVVIIGSGPAGWTAAIYAARANLSPIVYEGAISEENRLRGTLPLGQLNLTTEVENFPGFPRHHGTRADDADAPAGRALRHAHRHRGHRRRSISKRARSHEGLARATIERTAVIIATGASANYLGLESEEKFKNRGVSACAVCDGAPAALPQQAADRRRRRRLGGGRGHYLTKFASSVHLVTAARR